VLKQLEQYNISKEVARRELKENRHNNITTTYYLLIKKLKDNDKKFSETLQVDKRNQTETTQEEDNVRNNRTVVKKSKLKQFIKAFSKKMGFKVDKDYYKKRSEFCHNKRSARKAEGITEQRKIANRNRWNAPARERRAEVKSRHNKTPVYFNDDKSQIENLSFDLLAKVINKRKCTNVKNTSEEYEGRKVEIGTAIVDSSNLYTTCKQRPYDSVSPHHKHTLYQPKDKAIEEPIKELPITIIHTPQINNINNYNNINIHTIAINDQYLVPHPPSPPFNGTNQFRMRKYRIKNN
jgi:hypothetical protein